MTISECYVDMTFMEYDTVEEITVPEEAVSSATDSGAAGGLDLPQDDTYGDGSVVKPAEPAEQNSNLGDSWESYTVQVNNTVLTLPCTVSDLEAAGVNYYGGYDKYRERTERDKGMSCRFCLC